jgi:hypothetical protein
VGSGLPDSMLFGRPSSTTGSGGGGGAVTTGVGVCLVSGVVEGALFLLAGSARVLRAGSFLFLSMTTFRRYVAKIVVLI